MEEDVREALRLEPASVELDHVARLDERVQLAGPAVDAHAAGLDQPSAPRREATPARARYALSLHDGMILPVPHYISLMRWTSQGMAGLPGWRERVEDGERIIEAAGGKLIGVYVTMGRYDVVEIFEAPDDEVAIEILMKLNRFAAEHTETLRAFTREEAEEMIRRL